MNAQNGWPKGFAQIKQLANVTCKYSVADNAIFGTANPILPIVLTLLKY